MSFRKVLQHLQHLWVVFQGVSDALTKPSKTLMVPKEGSTHADMVALTGAAVFIRLCLSSPSPEIEEGEGVELLSVHPRDYHHIARLDLHRNKV